MPLAKSRARRLGLVGTARVARATTSAATAAVVAHGVNRRTDGRHRRR
jgi:hypothetical protein